MTTRALGNDAPWPASGEPAQWRRRQLERAGFAPDRAASLAEDPRSDVHGLLELVDRGCPPELAARILAPLDDGRGPGR